MKKKILLSASLFHAANDATTVAIPMIFTLLYSQNFIIMKYSHIGILSYFGLFTTFLFQILIVNYAHRVEYKHMLLFSLAGVSFSLFMITFSSSFFSLLLPYLIMRAFMSFYHPIGIATVSRTHPDKGLDFAMGIQSGSGNLGVFLAFISIGYIAQSLGWKAPLYIWAGITFSVGIICFRVARNTSSIQKQYQKPNFSSWIQTLKEIKPLIPAFVYGGACWSTTVYFAPSLLNHKFHIPLGETGIFLAAWIILGAIMPYLFGYMSKIFGRRNIAITGIAGSALMVFFLGISRFKLLTIASLLLYGSFLFMIYPAFQSYVGSRISPSKHTIAFSLVANVQMLTGAITNLVSGFISDMFGINYPFIFLTFLGIFTCFYYVWNRKFLQI